MIGLNDVKSYNTASAAQRHNAVRNNKEGRRQTYRTMRTETNIRRETTMRSEATTRSVTTMRTEATMRTDKHGGPMRTDTAQ